MFLDPRRYVLSTLVGLLVPSLASAAIQTIDGSVPLPGAPHGAPFDPALSPGEIAQKPGETGSFFVDPNQGGAAEALHLVELTWCRLVDVHGLDANGAIDPTPVFRDFGVNEIVQSGGSHYRLLPSYATQTSRLVILREPGTPEFAALLAAAEMGLPPIIPKAENAPPPFSFVARNSVLVARFDDLLRDGDEAALALSENVRTFVLGSGRLPYSARVVFDPNHGGIARGKFHSTRVLIDLTVSEFEASSLPTPLAINLLGLPASPNGTDASASVRIPTRTDFASGQFTRLTNLSGRGLALTGNGPVDLFSPTRDVVRAMRAGKADDQNNGFLLDLDPPALLGSFPLDVTSASPDPQGAPGFAFIVGWTFAAECGLRPLAGNVLVAGSRSLELIANGSPLTPGGSASGVRVHLPGTTPATAAELLGSGLLRASFRAGGPPDRACWIQFSPSPLDPPSDGVAPTVRVAASFSEPMDPASIRPLDSLRIVRGNGAPAVDATSIVVAEVLASADATAFALTPLLPLAHATGTATPYQVQIATGSGGVTDLAGNPMALFAVPPIDFRLDPLAPSESNGGVALRFTGNDELAPIGATDLRGAFYFDLTRGTIRPRPPAFTSASITPDKPVPSLMNPIPGGVFTPLSPLGSKLHQVWRYCDVGWSVTDESKYDIDIVGLNWSPANGQVISDFYEGFEIRLAHSRYLPDEELTAFLLPQYPNSGLRGGPNPFTSNILEDPRSPQKVVHPRVLGYSVNPSQLFVTPQGDPMMPYPLNRGPGAIQSYTWRDTAVLATAGPNGAGIPTAIEVGAPLFLAPTAGAVAPAGQVPSIGLPLLMEFRCYPSDTALGLNRFDVSLAINSSPLPSFRAFSTGGVNTSGSSVIVNPDLALVPQGGFNPASTPPGLRTLSSDNVVYMGQLDLVTRVSRAHTIWIDTHSTADYFPPFIEGDPAPNALDARAITLEFRGADGYTGPGVHSEFDAASLNCYGDIRMEEERLVIFHNGQSAWTADINAVDGARYLQIRITLTNDIERETSPELDSIGIAFLH